MEAGRTNRDDRTTPSDERIETGTHGSARPKERVTRDKRLDRVAKRAHEIYEARGGQHGRDLDDWLQAEREIDAEAEPPIEPPTSD